MKITIDKTAIEFCATIVSVAEGLSPESVLYWSRNKDELERLLQKENFEPITKGAGEPYKIPALGEASRKTLAKKRFIPHMFLDTFIDNVPKGMQPATPPALAHSYRIQVRLERDELLYEIGDLDTLKSSAFSYPQLCFLASRHRGPQSTRKAILDYDGYAYASFITARDELTFVGMFSRKNFSRHKKWEFYFEDHTFRQNALLLLREEVISVV